MSDSAFEQLASVKASGGGAAALDRLAETLLEQQDYHKLFDARMLKRKFELGLPLSRPASLQDVPEDQRKTVEEAYVAAAREAGALFLKQGDIPAAWMYLQVIREPESVAAAIAALPESDEYSPQREQIVQIALYQGVHPEAGLKMMLRSHGTCSSITSLDQVLHGMSPEQRDACAKIMVRNLYRDLHGSVLRHVQQRVPTIEPDVTLRQLLAGRDWLFEEGGYHIDTSHLSSVVRFARNINPPAEELDMAIQLSEYGKRLDSRLQYGSEPPFDDYYPAHIAFFKALIDKDRDASLQFFRDKLAAAPDEQAKALPAFVLVDLLIRCGRSDEAVSIAAGHLAHLNDDASFSFADLCRQTGRFDLLRQAAAERNDLVGFTAALLQE
ncbi:MAG: hypothetical protein JNG89_15610 [Planctomycetaceae bacterium]|nr:hypothetical protein [Planctomycetaceae bacterium]